MITINAITITVTETATVVILCVVGSLSFSAEATALLSVSELIAAVEGVPVD